MKLLKNSKSTITQLVDEDCSVWHEFVSIFIRVAKLLIVKSLQSEAFGCENGNAENVTGPGHKRFVSTKIPFKLCN